MSFTTEQESPAIAGGTSSGVPNTDASLIPVPSDTETYGPAPSGVISGCPSFGGSYTVTAGHTSIGCVISRVPGMTAGDGSNGVLGYSDELELGAHPPICDARTDVGRPLRAVHHADEGYGHYVSHSVRER